MGGGPGGTNDGFQIHLPLTSGRSVSLSFRSSFGREGWGGGRLQGFPEKMNALEAFPLHGAWPQEFLGLEDENGEKARLSFHSPPLPTHQEGQLS